MFSRYKTSFIMFYKSCTVNWRSLYKKILPVWIIYFTFKMEGHEVYSLVITV